MKCDKSIFENIRRGEMYYVQVNKNNTVGSEQSNDRPAIIVSNNVGNKHSDIVEVVYLTTKPKKNLPTHVNIHTAPRKSVALCEQIYTISKLRLVKYIGRCSDMEIQNIDDALMVSLSLLKANRRNNYGR